MLKIFGSRTGSSLRVVWLAQELKINYEIVEVSLKNGDHKREEFLSLNPAGQIPVIDDEGFILSESLAINTYLSQKHHSSLHGATTEMQALVNQWSLWAIFNLQKEFSRLMALRKQEKVDNQLQEEVYAHINKHLSRLEDHLAIHPYIVGTEFSLADINVSVTMGYAAWLSFDISQYTHIQKWMDTLSTREAYQQARAQ